MGSNGAAYAMLTGSVIVWAGSSIAGKLAVTGFPPFSVGAIRFVLTSMFLIILSLWQEKRLVMPPRSDWPILFILGLVGLFGANAIFYVGLQYTTATNSALIMAGSPIVITIFSALILRETILPKQLFGIILSFLGVVVVVIKGSWIVLTNLSFNVGDLILLANPILWGLYSVLCTKVNKRYSSLQMTTYATIIGTFLFIPGMLYEKAWANASIHITLTGWSAMGYLAVASAIGIIWWNKGIASIGASRSGIFMNGVPIVAMFFSVLLLGETIIISQIVGALMVISGVYLNSLRTQQKTHLPEVEEDS